MQNQIINLTLKNIKKVGVLRDIPNISEINAEYLKNLIGTKKPQHILEIGTANGYSTLQFAYALLDYPSDNGTITTIEYAWNMHCDAVENFKNCKLKNIHAIWGDAKTIIPILKDSYFDFVFIDAMKREYLDYLLLLMTKMTENAIIIIDDVIKFRNKMENLYDFLDRNEIAYNIYSTDPDDGIMIIYFSDLCSKALLQL